MRYRKRDSAGDMIFGNGQLDFYKDVPDAPQQAVQTRLELIAGEWFLDSSEGTEWLTGVLGKQTQGTPDRTIRDRILGTQGVVDIANYQSQSDPDTRKFSVQTLLDTVYGPSTLQKLNFNNF